MLPDGLIVDFIGGSWLRRVSKPAMLLTKLNCTCDLKAGHIVVLPVF